MTRINIGIKPSELTQKHLLAEAREIKRIPNCITKGRYSLEGQPKEFKLGAGHVKYFYDKCGYLLERYNQLYEECIRRGLNVTCFRDAWEGVPEHLMKNYTPTSRDREIIIERLIERDESYKEVFKL